MHLTLSLSVGHLNYVPSRDAKLKKNKAEAQHTTPKRNLRTQPQDLKTHTAEVSPLPRHTITATLIRRPITVPITVTLLIRRAPLPHHSHARTTTGHTGGTTARSFSQLCSALHHTQSTQPLRRRAKHPATAITSPRLSTPVHPLHTAPQQHH